MPIATPTDDLASGLRVHHPAQGIIAFYDGRTDRRLLGPDPNWVDDGAYVLGTASYAVVEGDEALVYDAHITLAHARVVRRHLEQLGIRRMTLVLSHWHLDHVAGNAAFADCEIVANRRTAELLAQHRSAIEAGTKSGPPAISPLVLPNRLFEETLDLSVGSRRIRLFAVDSHSTDGTVAWLEDERLLLAGDTLEDPLTYVVEPERLLHHLRGLDVLASLNCRHILPNHGSESVIAGGGFGPGLIAANQCYVEALLALSPEQACPTLQDILAEHFAAGSIHPFAPYESVHRRNVAAVQEAHDA
jgi:cyclase